MYDNIPFQQLRCSNVKCGKVLAEIKFGVVREKCPKCGTVTTIQIDAPQQPKAPTGLVMKRL